MTCDTLYMLYLHKNGVVHRGIRSSRVLVSGNLPPSLFLLCCDM